MKEHPNKIKVGFKLKCDGCGKGIFRSTFKKEKTYNYKKNNQSITTKSQKLLCFGCRFV